MGMTSIIGQMSDKKRDDINIPEYVNFGLEIECDHVNKKDFTKKVSNFSKSLVLEEDGSMNRDGLEVSTPVLNNNKESLFMLKRLSNLLKELEHDFERASLQINLDDNFINDEERINFLKAYAYFEPIFMRFCTGYDDEFRDVYKRYAAPIFYDLKSEMKEDNGLSFLTDSKTAAVSFKHIGKNLIEYRLPNGCDDYELWFNYVNLFYNFQRIIENGKYDKEKVDFTFDHFDVNRYKSYTKYVECFPVDMSLYDEFVDTFFNNEYDKLYFDKQYIRKRKVN